MFHLSVRAAGVAALFGACALCLPLADAGDWRGWTPRKSSREVLHPNDCQFGHYGTTWRAWPEACDQRSSCANSFAPPVWSPSMSPLPNMPAPSWQVPLQSDPLNSWTPLPQSNLPTRGPQLPQSYGPLPTAPPSVPTAPVTPKPQAPTLPPIPSTTQPLPVNSAPIGQRLAVPPMPTTMAPNSRGSATAVVPAGGWNRSVPAKLSSPDFGPSAIQPMNYSTPQRAGSSVPKRLGEQSPNSKGPVTLMRPEF